MKEKEPIFIPPTFVQREGINYDEFDQIKNEILPMDIDIKNAQHHTTDYESTHLQGSEKKKIVSAHLEKCMNELNLELETQLKYEQAQWKREEEFKEQLQEEADFEEYGEEGLEDIDVSEFYVEPKVDVNENDEKVNEKPNLIEEKKKPEPIIIDLPPDSIKEIHIDPNNLAFEGREKEEFMAMVNAVVAAQEEEVNEEERKKQKEIHLERRIAARVLEYLDLEEEKGKCYSTEERYEIYLKIREQVMEDEEVKRIRAEAFARDEKYGRAYSERRLAIEWEKEEKEWEYEDDLEMSFHDKFAYFISGSIGLFIAIVLFLDWL